MKLSVSFLSVKKDLEIKIQELNNINEVYYLHVDVMDGNFVKNRSFDDNEIIDILSKLNKPLDVHLMVKDIDKYYQMYRQLNPNFITIHYEAIDNINNYIDIFHNDNIKFGLAINPSTPIEDIIEYLPRVDLILVMSVEPGLGGQSFISNSANKIRMLKQLRELNDYQYLISIDGGINNTSINRVFDADIVVVGSYITDSNNYEKQINEILKGEEI